MPTEEEKLLRKKRRDEIVALRAARENGTPTTHAQFTSLNDFDLEFIEKI